MRQFIRKKTGMGFNVVPNAKRGFSRLMRTKIQGYGLGPEVFENMDKASKSTPMDHLNQKMTHLTVKSAKPKKYISLNL